MSRNTDTGVRYLCGSCAAADGREIVKIFPSKYGGPCRKCGHRIERGEATYVLDSGIRKGRKPDQTTQFDQTSLFDPPT